MSLVYKAVATKVTTNKNTFSGNVSSDNLSVSTGGSIYDNYFHFIKENDNKLTLSTTAYDDYFNSWTKNIFMKFIPTSLTETYDIFYQSNGETGGDSKTIFVYIANGVLFFDLNLGGTPYSTARAEFITEDDLNTELCCWFGFNILGNDHRTYAFKNETQFGTTTTIYSNATAVDFTSVDENRIIAFNITGSINDSYYVKDIVLHGNFHLTYIDNYIPYLQYDVLPLTTSEIVYTMSNQNFSTTVINSGSAGSIGNGIIVDETNFYNIVIPNTASYHKMFDNNIHNNILSTENISSNDAIPYTIPSCEYLAERQAIMKDKAREKAAEKTNYTFCYDINDDYYTNYMSVGTRTYVPWFFLYDSRGMVDSTTGYCSAIDLLNNNNVNSTVYAEYGNSGNRNWMVDFKRKLFGTHKISPLTIYNDTAFRVQLHRTEKWKPSFAWLQTYGSATNYDSVYNICSDDWGVPGAFHFIDTIDVDYDGHRYFDLRISNNYNFEFTQIGSNTYTYDYVNWNYKTAPLRFNKTSLDYYKKINPSAMRIIPGTYQVFFDYEHSLLRNYDYDWNLIPYKKVVTLGYFIFIVDTSTNKFSIFDTYIDYNNEEIDMTANPADDTYFKYGQNSSYGYFTLPNDLTETQFYAVSPIYSNIILAGQTNVFPTYKRVGGALDRMEFNSKVPTKANATKLIPKTKAKIHFKKIV